MVVALGLPMNGVRPAKTWLAVDTLRVGIWGWLRGTILDHHSATAPGGFPACGVAIIQICVVAVQRSGVEPVLY